MGEEKTIEIKADVGDKTGQEYSLEEPIDVLGVKYDKMVFLVKPGDKAAFDNVSNAPCVTVKLHFEGISTGLNIPVFTVEGFVENKEVSKMLNEDLEEDC